MPALRISLHAITGITVCNTKLDIEEGEVNFFYVYYIIFTCTKLYRKILNHAEKYRNRQAKGLPNKLFNYVFSCRQLFAAARHKTPGGD